MRRAELAALFGVDVLLVQRFLGHGSLSQMEHYAKLAERFVFGEARQVQREILMIFCPGLPAPVIDHLLPDRPSFFETFQTGGLRRRRSRVQIEDVLFDGAAYAADLPLVDRPARGLLHGMVS